MTEGDAYSLEIAATPEALSVVRLFAASVLRAAGVDEPVVEDVKLALSELAARAADRSTGEPLRVRFEETASGFRVRLSPLLRPATDGVVDPFDIARALFPDAELDTAEGVAGFDVPVDRALDPS